MSEAQPTRVLYMEDDRGLARLFQRRLERAGYAVDLAPDGEQGLEMYASGTYDVVAVDQVMPRLTGLDVIRALAAQGPLPPLVMVTGTGSERIAVEAMKLGANDYIVKDVDGGYLELLPTVIERALEQHHLQEEKRRADEERERLIKRLQEALAAVKTLSGLLPICANCKNIRNDKGYWMSVEQYVGEHTEAVFTHGICPDCMKTLYGDMFTDEELRGNPADRKA